MCLSADWSIRENSFGIGGGDNKTTSDSIDYNATITTLRLQFWRRRRGFIFLSIKREKLQTLTLWDNMYKVRPRGRGGQSSSFRLVRWGVVCSIATTRGHETDNHPPWQPKCHVLSSAIASLFIN